MNIGQRFLKPRTEEGIIETKYFNSTDTPVPGPYSSTICITRIERITPRHVYFRHPSITVLYLYHFPRRRRIRTDARKRNVNLEIYFQLFKLQISSRDDDDRQFFPIVQFCPCFCASVGSQGILIAHAADGHCVMSCKVVGWCRRTAEISEGLR